MAAYKALISSLDLVFVSTISGDTFGISNAECIILGVPVVAFNASATQEALHPLASVLVNDFSVDAMARAVLFVLQGQSPPPAETDITYMSATEPDMSKGEDLHSSSESSFLSDLRIHAPFSPFNAAGIAVASRSMQQLLNENKQYILMYNALSAIRASGEERFAKLKRTRNL